MAREINSNEGVMNLLKPPALSYIRELSKVVEQDPEYLFFHSGSISLRLKSLLKGNEIGQTVLSSDRQTIVAVREAIIRLQSFEKQK